MEVYTCNNNNNYYNNNNYVCIIIMQEEHVNEADNYNYMYTLIKFVFIIYNYIINSLLEQLFTSRAHPVFIQIHFNILIQSFTNTVIPPSASFIIYHR